MKTTLLITTFNRGNLLDKSLQRLCNLTLPDDVLIVDDGSSDKTKDIVESFKTKLPIRYIFNNSPQWTICSMARNIGIKNTDADIIITAEPELLFVTDVIPQMLVDHKKHPKEIISAGTIYHAQTHTDFHPGLVTDPITALKDSIVIDYQTEPRAYPQTGYCKTKNLQATWACLYKRDWLIEIGGWDEGFPGAWGFDDIELCTRLRINGINQFVDLDIECVHQWHSHLPPHIQGPMMTLNDDYFKSKRLDLLAKGDSGLIANAGKEWGVIK